MQRIDGHMLKRMIIAGANEITINMSTLNALNVFPVPDGDTGTNMSNTVRAAAIEVSKLNTSIISDIAKTASNGALRGARGNSGVITSQLFRGLAKGFEGKKSASAEDFASALTKATEMAYKAVMKPKEGTMLTIAKAASEAASEFSFDDDDIEKQLEYIIKKSDEMLARTPSMLPALKQAGVVDSGGMGIIFFLKGMLKACNMLVDPDIEDIKETEEITPAAALSPDDIIFTYCTEFLIETTKKNAEDSLKSFLANIGDSAVVIEDEGLIKVHVHTNNPGLALEKALQFGSLLNIKIDNMKFQHTELKSPQKQLGIVAVAAGSGFVEIFKNLGVDFVIEGGQSMNPSTEEILNAIEKINAEHIIILPNNKNIILAAEQAGHLVKDKHLHVLPTKSIPQGIACIMSKNDILDIDDNINYMKNAMENINTGQITEAVRDTILDGFDIKTGDMLCIYNGDIVKVAKDLQSAAQELVDYMLSFGGEIVTIYYGEHATNEQAEKLVEYITQKYEEVEDVEIHHGNQPIYSFIISVE